MSDRERKSEDRSGSEGKGLGGNPAVLVWRLIPLLAHLRGRERSVLTDHLFLARDRAGANSEEAGSAESDTGGSPENLLFFPDLFSEGLERACAGSDSTPRSEREPVRTRTVPATVFELTVTDPAEDSETGTSDFLYVEVGRSEATVQRDENPEHLDLSVAATPSLAGIQFERAHFQGLDAHGKSMMSHWVDSQRAEADGGARGSAPSADFLRGRLDTTSQIRTLESSQVRVHASGLVADLLEFYRDLCITATDPTAPSEWERAQTRDVRSRAAQDRQEAECDQFLEGFDHLPLRLPHRDALGNSIPMPPIEKWSPVAHARTGTNRQIARDAQRAEVSRLVPWNEVSRDMPSISPVHEHLPDDALLAEILERSIATPIEGNKDGAIPYIRYRWLQGASPRCIVQDLVKLYAVEVDETFVGNKTREASMDKWLQDQLDASTTDLERFLWKLGKQAADARRQPAKSKPRSRHG